MRLCERYFVAELAIPRRRPPLGKARRLASACPAFRPAAAGAPKCRVDVRASLCVCCARATARTISRCVTRCARRRVGFRPMSKSRYRALWCASLRARARVLLARHGGWDSELRAHAVRARDGRVRPPPGGVHVQAERDRHPRELRHVFAASFIVAPRGGDRRRPGGLAAGVPGHEDGAAGVLRSRGRGGA